MKKKFFAVALAATMALSNAFTAFADDDAADTYAAFCVEVTDGTNYFTTTSAGDAWGAGDAVNYKDTGNAAKGGSYTVSMTRTGNNFVAKYVDNGTGAAMYQDITLTGNADFGTTTVYVMGQVGTLTVECNGKTDTVTGTEWWAATNGKSTAIDLADGSTVTFKVDVAGAAQGTDDQKTDDNKTDDKQTDDKGTSNPTTSDVAPIAAFAAVAVVACAAVIVSRKKVTE